jgi:hypothetical protein
MRTVRLSSAGARWADVRLPAAEGDGQPLRR